MRLTRLLTYLVYCGDVDTLSVAIKKRIGCDLENKDIFSMTCEKHDPETMICTLTVWNHSKFNQNNAL